MCLKYSQVVATESVTTDVNILIAPVAGTLLDNNRSAKGNARRKLWENSPKSEPITKARLA